MSFFSSHESNYMKKGNIYDKSTDSENAESIIEQKSLEKMIYKKFNKKYSKMPLKYNSIRIDNIIFNDKTHLVSIFKELLILNDKAEFLKRFYAFYESLDRLPKFFEFYELYSKIFPNYTSIEEGKYFYMNIQQKQRVINTIEKIELENKLNKKSSANYNNYSDDKVFSTNVIDSLLNSTNDEGMEMLFNINKKNIKKEESLFAHDVNNIIEEIGKYQNVNESNEKKNMNLFQKKHINHIVKINNNNKYIIKIKNINCENINHNFNDVKKEIKLNIENHNNQIDKAKYKNNKENYNILNLNTKTNYTKVNLYHKPNSKIINITKLILMDKFEKSHNKTRQKYAHNKKSLSYNVSTVFKSKNDISNSKHNKSLYSKKQKSISSNKNNIKKNNQNRIASSKNKKKKNEVINYKKELLKIDLSKTKLSSRNKVLNFSLSKLSNNKYSNNTNHNSFIFKNNKSYSKNNILNNTNVANYNKKVYSNNNYNVFNSYSRNKSLKNVSKIKRSATNRNSEDFSKEKIYSTNKIKYIKRNESKIDNLFGNTSSMLSYNDAKKNTFLNQNNQKYNSHLNSVIYLSNLTTRRESKKSNSKKKLIKEALLNPKNINKEVQTYKGKVLKQKNSFKNVNNSKAIKRNNSVLRIGIEKKNIIKKGKIKNIKINNFSKLFNVFVKHQYNNNTQFLNPQSERNGIKIKI